MAKEKIYKFGIVAIMGIFLMVVAVPALAGVSNDNSEKTGLFQGFKGKKLQNNVDGGMRSPGHGPGALGDDSVIEELTGLDADAIKAELEAGKTMEEILEEAEVTQEEVQSKMQEQREARLQELLDEGEITQEQYDELIAKEAGPRMRGPGHGRGAFGNNSVIEELTGLDADAIKADLEAGKTMEEILEEAGVTQEEVQSKMQEQREARLQELLDEGEITQEQYDELIAKTPANEHFNKMKPRFKDNN